MCPYRYLLASSNPELSHCAENASPYYIIQSLDWLASVQPSTPRSRLAARAARRHFRSIINAVSTVPLPPVSRRRSQGRRPHNWTRARCITVDRRMNWPVAPRHSFIYSSYSLMLTGNHFVLTAQTACDASIDLCSVEQLLHCCTSTIRRRCWSLRAAAFAFLIGEYCLYPCKNN